MRKHFLVSKSLGHPVDIYIQQNEVACPVSWLFRSCKFQLPPGSCLFGTSLKELYRPPQTHFGPRCHTGHQRPYLSYNPGTHHLLLRTNWHVELSVQLNDHKIISVICKTIFLSWQLIPGFFPWETNYWRLYDKYDKYILGASTSRTSKPQIVVEKLVLDCNFSCYVQKGYWWSWRGSLFYNELETTVSIT